MSKVYEDKRGFRVELAHDAVVYCYPQGGGLSYLMPAQTFLDNFKEAAPLPYVGINVTVEGWGEFSIGAYSNGNRWNGWVKPYFPFEEAMEVAQKMGDTPYNEEKDCFVTVFEDIPDEPEEWAAEMIEVDGKQIKVYAIGAGFWTWEKA